MKKYALIMLLVLALSFSTMAAAESLEGFFISLENIPNLTIVEIQAVSAPDFGGVAVLSVNLSEQIVQFSLYPEGYFNNTVKADPYIGVEIDYIKPVPLNELIITNIEVSRGGYLHFASHY